MPDPREEGDLARIKAQADAYASERDALRARLAEAEHDATSSASAVARLHELLADAVTRAETAEAACETSGAALVVMNDLLKEAEADRDEWRASAEDALVVIRQTAARVDTLTEALEEIAGMGDESDEWDAVDKYEQARDRARVALAAVKGRENANG